MCEKGGVGPDVAVAPQNFQREKCALLSAPSKVIYTPDGYVIQMYCSYIYMYSSIHNIMWYYVNLVYVHIL